MHQQCGKPEIDHQRKDIIQGGDERAGSGGRVNVNFFEKNRDYGSNKGSQNQGEEKGAPDYQSEMEVFPESNRDKNDTAAYDPDNCAGYSFMADHFPIVFRG